MLPFGTPLSYCPFFNYDVFLIMNLQTAMDNVRGIFYGKKHERNINRNYCQSGD